MNSRTKRNKTKESYIDLDAMAWFLEQNGTDFQFFLKYEKYMIRQIVLYTIWIYADWNLQVKFKKVILTCKCVFS